MMWQSEILIVEDNPISRRTYQAALEHAGYRVRLAASGSEAFKALEAGIPDLLLLDLHLPDMSGMEVNRHVRNMPNGEALPILLISGFLSLLEERAALEAGFSAVLFKPCSPHHLVSTIRSYLPTGRHPDRQVGVGLRVLLVDDDPSSLKLQALQLEALGFQVRTESDSTRAVAHALEAPPHVIVTDVLMPEMDGFQLCHRLRQEPLLNGVPILLVSSEYVEAADRALAERAGAFMLAARTPDASTLAPFIVQAVEAHEAVPAERSPAPIQIEHGQRISHQLKRQLHLNQTLMRQSALQAAELSVLGAASCALSEGGDLRSTVIDVLLACQDSFNLARAALYLKQRDGSFALYAAVGFSEEAELHAQTCFGERDLFEGAMAGRSIHALPDTNLPRGPVEALLHAASVRSGLLAPLWSGQESMGLLFLGSVETGLLRPEVMSFVRTLGIQISQALALALTFDRLQISERKSRAILEEASCGILLTTLQGRILEANRRAEELLSHSGEPVQAGLLQRHVLDEDRVLMEARLNRWSTGRSAEHLELRLKESEGSILELDTLVRPISLDGSPLLLFVLNDHEEAKELRRRNTLNDKLATLGTLSAGIAHEINNPLAFLMHSLELLSNRLRAPALGEDADGVAPSPVQCGAEMEILIRRMDQALERIRDIVASVKGFARVEEAEVRPFKLPSVIEGALTMTRHLLRHRAQVDLDLQEGLPEVQGHPGKIQQVLINLLANAAHALPTARFDENRILVSAVAVEGWVRVSVADNGPGIPKATLARIFEPYFTTKPAGEGTGLGLSLCHEIVRQHGGDIRVWSQVGEGTRFEFDLQPVVPSQAQPLAGPLRDEAPVLLLVDDDANLLSSLSRLLRRHYSLTTVQGGLEAIQLLEAGGPVFDAIITDLHMPRCNGLDLYSDLKQRWPGMEERVVFMTGAGQQEASLPFLEALPNPKLAKPFPSSVLTQILEGFLRNRRQESLQAPGPAISVGLAGGALDQRE